MNIGVKREHKAEKDSQTIQYKELVVFTLQLCCGDWFCERLIYQNTWQNCGQ